MDPTIANKVIKAGVTEAYVPIARITVVDLTPTVSLLVPKLASLSELGDSLSQSEAIDATSLVKSGDGATVVSAKMVKMGNLRQLFISVKTTRKLATNETVGMFSLTGDARPLIGCAVGSDTVVGYVPESGNFWGSAKSTVNSGTTFTLSTGMYFAYA